MADIKIDTSTWRSHAGDVEGIGQAVAQSASAYTAALDGNVFGVFTPIVLPAYLTVSSLFSSANTASGESLQKGAESLKEAADNFDRNEQAWQTVLNAIRQQLGGN